MEIITVKDKSFKPYISEKEIHFSVQKVASKINHDYKKKEDFFFFVFDYIL